MAGHKPNEMKNKKMMKRKKAGHGMEMKRTKAMYGKEMRKKAAGGRMMYVDGGMPQAKPN